jgi:hypothetical protein
MAVQRKKLRVLPNPWLHIDEKGRPAGLCRLEQPSNGTFVDGWVGVTVSSVTEVEPAKRVKVKGRVFEQKPGIHYLTFAHADEPVTVDNTAYYRKRVACGDLIAHDVATAIACGIRGELFVEPEKLLAQIKAAAIRQFDAENGEGAFETLGDMAAEEAEQEAAVAASIAEQSLPVEPAPLEGITVPADGVERTVELEAAAGGAPLPPVETDGDGTAVLAEQTAPPAFTTEPDSIRSKSRKGSNQ